MSSVLRNLLRNASILSLYLMYLLSKERGSSCLSKPKNRLNSPPKMGRVVSSGQYLLWLCRYSYLSILRTTWSLPSEPFRISRVITRLIILGVIACLIGMALFLILSGVGGSCVAKPEEAANMQGIYMIPMMICYFVVIFGLVKYEGFMPLAYYLIPFTGAFLTPGALISGGISIAMGILSIIISIV